MSFGHLGTSASARFLCLFEGQQLDEAGGAQLLFARVVSALLPHRVQLCTSRRWRGRLCSITSGRRHEGMSQRARVASGWVLPLIIISAILCVSVLGAF
jgi:hypothetical protein